MTGAGPRSSGGQQAGAVIDVYAFCLFSVQQKVQPFFKRRTWPRSWVTWRFSTPNVLSRRSKS